MLSKQVQKTLILAVHVLAVGCSVLSTYLSSVDICILFSTYTSGVKNVFCIVSASARAYPLSARFQVEQLAVTAETEDSARAVDGPPALYDTRVVYSAFVERNKTWVPAACEVEVRKT